MVVEERDMFRTIIGLAAAAAIVAPAFAAEWMNDWEAAKARAASENKALLVNFTGSDWCVHCKRLRKAVLDTPAFLDYAQDKFILMEVDMPHNTPQPESLSRQNQQLCHEYCIAGFPTVLVISPEGRLYGGLPGAVLDIKTVQHQLDVALENGRKLAVADKLEGEERARLLYQVYQSLPESFRVPSKLGEVLLEADPDNVTGFRTEVDVRQQWHEISVRLEAAGTDPAMHRAVVTEALKTALPANRVKLQAMLEQLDFCDIYRQVEELADTPEKAVALLETKAKEVPQSILGEVLALKAEMQILAAKDVQDILAAKAAMEESYTYSPPSDQYRAYQEKRFADPSALLESAKKRRNRH